MGYDGSDIAHFQYYAERTGKSFDLADYDIQGETIDDHIQPLKWDWTWTQDNTGPGIFAKLGISGVALPKYDDTLCSGCSPIANMSNILALSAFKGEPLPKVEILNGKKMQARPGYDKTVLLGNCIIRANKDNQNINQAIEVKGCPPAENDVVDAMKAAGLEVNTLAYHGYLKQQGEKYNGKDGYDPELFTA
jgi:Ni,Fe-hydrogenase III small subunit